MKARLAEYDMMKTWGILLVVLGHVTNMYKPNGLVALAECPEMMEWISGLLYSFHMPLFVFVSGAVFAYQTEVMGKEVPFSQLIKKKCWRLLLPYLFWAFAVMLPLMVCCGFRENIWDYAYRGLFLSQDSRHLWFVLMLFEVFVLFWAMRRAIRSLRLPLWSVIIVSLVLYLSSNQLPYVFQLNMMLRYQFWFSLGYVFMMHRESVKAISFCLLACVILIYNLKEMHHLYFRMPLLGTLTALAGIMLFYYVSFATRNTLSNKYVAMISDNSFGIYLFHVPIIYLLYYFFGSLTLSPYLFAVLAFVVSLVCSIMATMATRRLGLRILIGEKKV